MLDKSQVGRLRLLPGFDDLDPAELAKHRIHLQYGKFERACREDQLRAGMTRFIHIRPVPKLERQQVQPGMTIIMQNGYGPDVSFGPEMVADSVRILSGIEEMTPEEDALLDPRLRGRDWSRGRLEVVLMHPKGLKTPRPPEWFRTDIHSQERLREAAAGKGIVAWNRKHSDYLTVGATVVFRTAYGNNCDIFEGEVLSIHPLHPRRGEEAPGDDIVVIENVRKTGVQRRKGLAERLGL